MQENTPPSQKIMNHWTLLVDFWPWRFREAYTGVLPRELLSRSESTFLVLLQLISLHDSDLAGSGVDRYTA